MKTIFILTFLIAVLLNQSRAQDTTTTSSGLKYIVIEKGNGIPSEINKAVEVHYTGYLLDGKIFDSSRDRNEPLEFVLGAGQVIKGWDEGISLMSVGDKLRLIIPPELAYGSKGAGDLIPPNATLVFDVELVGVSEPKQSIADALLQTILEKDIQTAVSQYNDLKANHADEYNFKESQLNTLGYRLLQAGKNKEAIEILKLNAESFPNSANVYDSLGEAYMFNGNVELAMENYKKSLELNPSNKNAQEKIGELSK